MNRSLEKMEVSAGPLRYEYACLMAAERMMQAMWEEIEQVSDPRLRRDLEMSYGNIADQLADARCGVGRYLHVPED